MGRLIFLFFILMNLISAESDYKSEFVWYRQIELNLTDSYLLKGEKIPTNHREWPIIKDFILVEGSSSVHYMKMTNRLALVPGFPVVSEFSEKTEKKISGSRVIAVSRSPVALDRNPGRYVILVKPNSKSVWATWFTEDDAKILFESLGGFDPSKEPILFPEVDERIESERLAAEREQKEIQKIIAEQLSAREGKRSSGKSDPVEESVVTAAQPARSIWWSVASVTFVLIALITVALVRRKQSIFNRE